MLSFFLNLYSFLWAAPTGWKSEICSSKSIRLGDLGAEELLPVSSKHRAGTSTRTDLVSLADAGIWRHNITLTRRTSAIMGPSAVRQSLIGSGQRPAWPAARLPCENVFWRSTVKRDVFRSPGPMRNALLSAARISRARQP